MRMQVEPRPLTRFAMQMDPHLRVCPVPCGLRRDSTDGLSPCLALPRCAVLVPPLGRCCSGLLGVSSSLLQGIQRIMCVVSYHIVARSMGSSASASVLLSVVTSSLAGVVNQQAAPYLYVTVILRLATTPVEHPRSALRALCTSPRRTTTASNNNQILDGKVIYCCCPAFSRCPALLESRTLNGPPVPVLLPISRYS
jgi:hypothetical protein